MNSEPLTKEKVQNYTEADYYEGDTWKHKAFNYDDVASAVKMFETNFIKRIREVRRDHAVLGIVEAIFRDEKDKCFPAFKEGEK